MREIAANLADEVDVALRPYAVAALDAPLPQARACIGDVIIANSNPLSPHLCAKIESILVTESVSKVIASDLPVCCRLGGTGVAVWRSHARAPPKHSRMHALTRMRTMDAHDGVTSVHARSHTHICGQGRYLPALR